MHQDDYKENTHTHPHTDTQVLVRVWRNWIPHEPLLWEYKVVQLLWKIILEFLKKVNHSNHMPWKFSPRYIPNKMILYFHSKT